MQYAIYSNHNFVSYLYADLVPHELVQIHDPVAPGQRFHHAPDPASVVSA